MSQLTSPQRRETAKHREAFEAWYEAGRSFRRILQDVAVPERTLYQWATWFSWHDRADHRDMEIARLAEESAIRDRAKRMEDQRRAGSLLRIRGMERLKDNGSIETVRDAISAIRTGIEIERQADVLPDVYLRIANATSIQEIEAIEAQLVNAAATRERFAPLHDVTANGLSRGQA